MTEVSDTDADTLGAARTLVRPFTFEQLAAAITPAPSRKAE